MIGVSVVLWMIAALGTILTTVLFIKLLNFESELKLRRYRAKTCGFADFLNYASEVKDGVILGKNGALTAAFVYQAPDEQSSTKEEREFIVIKINQIFARLDTGWMVHIDAIRHNTTEYPNPKASYFPDEVTAAIDAERANLFASLGAMYDGYFVIAFTWLPPLLSQQKFINLMFDDEQKALDKKQYTLSLIEQFERSITDIEHNLSGVINLTRLKSYQQHLDYGEYGAEEVTFDNLLEYINYCIKGHYHPLRLPRTPTYLDNLLGSVEMFGGVIPKIGTKYVQVVAIDGFPTESYPGILSNLNELPFAYRFNTRFIFLDRSEAKAILENRFKKWRQKIRGFLSQFFNTHNGMVDEDAAAVTQDASLATKDLNSGAIGFGYYSANIIIMDEDRARLETNARTAAKVIDNLGFSARIETINTVDAYFGSLPSHGFANLRKVLVHTLNLADFIPTSSIWSGEEFAPNPKYHRKYIATDDAAKQDAAQDKEELEHDNNSTSEQTSILDENDATAVENLTALNFAPNDIEAPALMACITGRNTPFRLNLHVDDVGHTLILGPTGAGKSTHLSLLAAQFRRYQGMRIFAFDVGKSMYPLTAAINGATGGKSGLFFNIGTADETVQNQQFISPDAVQEQQQQTFEKNDLSFCPLQFLATRSDKAFALQWLESILVLNDVVVTPLMRNEITNALNTMAQTGTKTLSDFWQTIQNEQVKEVISVYTNAGAMGYLLDAESDDLSFADFNVFEVQHLIELDHKYCLPVLMYLFRRIEKSLDGRPCVIFLDEAWTMLGHKVFKDKIIAWLRTLRKLNCSVVMATQFLSDITASGLLDILNKSCPSKIFLPDAAAASDLQSKQLYYSLGLNDKQINIISYATPKRDYYYTSPKGRRLYSLALGELALAFVGASDKDSLRHIENLQRKYGFDWYKFYLKEKRINYPFDLQMFSHLEPLFDLNRSYQTMQQNS